MDRDRPPPGSNVALYLRCSTTGQENSIADQRRVIDRTVSEHRLSVTDVYIDEGLSGGTIIDRPGLDRLLADGREKKFAYVLVYDVSRLSRGGNTDFWFLVRQLREARVQIFCCSRQMLVNERNALLFSVEATTGIEHNKKHARDITRTVLSSVVDRKSDPGRLPPYGYDRLYIDTAGNAIEQIRHMPDGTKLVLDPATLEVRSVLKKGEARGKVKSHINRLVPSDPERVQTLQRMFEMARHIGLAGIADTLNTEGVPGINGKKWSMTTVRSILLNPVYVGDIVYSRTRKSRYFHICAGEIAEHDELEQGKENFQRHGKDQWIIVPGVHEPLVSRELFEEVQQAIERRKKNKHRPGRSKTREYLLSGISTCARCGQPLHGHTTRSSKPKAKEYPRYACSTARKHGKNQCARYSFSAGAVEEFAVGSIRDILTSPAALAAVRRGVEKHLAARMPARNQADRIRRELAELTRRKGELFRNLDPARLAFFQPQVDQMMQDEQRLKHELAQAERQTPVLDKKAFIEKAVTYFQGQVVTLQGACRRSIREVLKALGVQLVYDPDRKEGVLRIDPFGHAVSGC